MDFFEANERNGARKSRETLERIHLMSDELFLVVTEAGGSMSITDAILRVAKGLGLDDITVMDGVRFAIENNLVAYSIDGEHLLTTSSRL